MEVSLRVILIGGASLLALALPSSALASDSGDELSTIPVISDPAVFGGEPSPVCAWPTTVHLSSGGSFCTGTLVHPQVVIYAAHCGNISQVRFGEVESSAAFSVSTQACQTNPNYNNGNSTGQDHAFCVLSEPVENVEIVPVLMGCETDVLQPGKDTTIVGFGVTDTNSLGTKYQVTTQINSVTTEAFIGGNGQDSCQGDSGGPVYVRLDEADGGDGTWRVFGITSYGGACGTGGYYSMMHIGMPWIEGELAQYGIDITPCHDSDGTWNPGPECFSFPYSPDSAGGSWSPACNPGELSGYSSTCGTPFNSEPDDTPPQVSLITPTDQSQYDSMGAGSVSINISAGATDGDGWGVQKVTLLIDGSEVASDTSAPYEWPAVSFPTGSYTLEAVAEDLAGNVATSAPHQIGVDETPDPPEPPPTTSSDTGGDEDGELGTSDDAGQFDEDGDGKGCACSAQPDSGWTPGLLVFGLLGLARRRS